MAQPSLFPGDPPVVIFTDGACENNPGSGGWAAILGFGRHRKTISGGCRQTTNNRMGHPENEQCDRLAVAARRQAVLTEDTGFVAPEAVHAALGLMLL